MKPKILLTNDDGINSIGIWAAYDALSSFCDITVIAPMTQQSVVGRSISIFEPIRTNRIKVHGVDAYGISGKPTDAIIIGLFALHCNPDLVVSGINIGENLSAESIMTSGTVCAALEASGNGYKAIAFSLQVTDPGDKFADASNTNQNFEPAKKIVKKICQSVIKNGFPENVDMFNVNIPTKGSYFFEMTKLAKKHFQTDVEERFDPRGRPYYWIDGPLIKDADEGTDIHALRNGNVSITPITLDNTCLMDKGTFSKIFDQIE